MFNLETVYKCESKVFEEDSYMRWSFFTNRIILYCWDAFAKFEASSSHTVWFSCVLLLCFFRQMRYLKIPMGTGALDCRHAFVQFYSGLCGLCFAISCLMVLLPMNPHTDPVITKSRKEKGREKAKESTLPCGLGQQLCKQHRVLFTFVSLRREKVTQS